MYRSLLLLLLGLGLCGQSVRSEGVDPSLDRAQEEGRRLQSGEITEISKEVKSAMEDLLLKEFGNESSDSADGDPAGKDYNATVEGESSQIETVVRISGSGSTPSSSNSSSASTSEAMGEEEPLSAAELIAAEGNMERSVDRIIDRHDNTFILSNPSSHVASLTLDAQLVADITVVLAAASVFGAVFEFFGQPTINGYLVAGALVGPGGLNLIMELVQVESLAQLGVSLLLFGLGMELDLKKLKAVWGVTMIGGALQIVLFMAIGGGCAVFLEFSMLQGIFIGALVSMSSTSVVVKCLESTKSTNTSFGGITIGTLILQDCSVGLMFALLPVFKPPPAKDENDDDIAEVNAAILLLVLKMLFKLSVALITGLLIAQYLLPHLLRLLRTSASKELSQLCMVSICLCGAWAFARFGLSEELGAFVAGVMVSVSNSSGKPEDEHLNLDRDSIESMHNVMAALFVASTALVISPRFLAQHIFILAIGTVLLIIVKSVLVAAVVSWFGYDIRTSLAVGVCMAHLGEFSIILLSLGRQFKILPSPVYALLLGIAALSLLATPFMIMGVSKLIGVSVPEHLPLPTREDREPDPGLPAPHFSPTPEDSPHSKGARDDSAADFMMPSMELPDNIGQEMKNNNKAGAVHSGYHPQSDGSLTMGMSSAMSILTNYRFGGKTKERKPAHPV